MKPTPRPLPKLTPAQLQERESPASRDNDVPWNHWIRTTKIAGVKIA